MATKVKKKKLTKTDGLGPYEIKRIRSAIRQVWSQCYARLLVIKRCTKEDGFSYCEICKKITPKLKVDHIEPVGDVRDGFITRLFCPSTRLQGLCNECHKIKTKNERAIVRQTRL